MSSINNNTTQSNAVLETTTRVYYEHYMTATPSFDLYPGLSRRLGNGYVHRPSRPSRPLKKQQTNFFSVHMNTTLRRSNPTASATTATNRMDDPFWQPQPQPLPQEAPSWDLYPSVLRNVSMSTLVSYLYQYLHTKHRLKTMEQTK